MNLRNLTNKNLAIVISMLMIVSMGSAITLQIGTASSKHYSNICLH